MGKYDKELNLCWSKVIVHKYASWKFQLNPLNVWEVVDTKFPSIISWFYIYRDAKLKCMKMSQVVILTIFQVTRQMKLLEEHKEKLESDSQLKGEAHLIDQKCAGLHNNTTDISFHSGMERVEQVILKWTNILQF